MKTELKMEDYLECITQFLFQFACTSNAQLVLSHEDHGIININTTKWPTTMFYLVKSLVVIVF